MWRNSQFTEEKLTELKKAFSMWFNDEEACLFADVWVRALYDYCSANEDFRELKELLKQKPKMKAKLNVIEIINTKWDEDKKERLETSKWYLERKAKDEFSLRSEIEWNILNETTMKVEYVEAEHQNYDENGNIINEKLEAKVDLTDEELEWE